MGNATGTTLLMELFLHLTGGSMWQTSYRGQLKQQTHQSCKLSMVMAYAAFKPWDKHMQLERLLVAICRHGTSCIFSYEVIMQQCFNCSYYCGRNKP